MKHALFPLFILCLSSCVYVPQNAHYCDTEHGVIKKQKVLTAEQLGPMGNCRADACAILLAGSGLVSAASLVVSGSIVVIANTVYWLEKPEQCANNTIKKSVSHSPS